MNDGPGASRPPLGIPQLWSACLRTVRRRRGLPSDPHGTGEPVDTAFAPADADLRQCAALGPAWDADARQLFALLQPLLAQAPGGAPWVIGQLGQSLDGCIATRGGDARALSGPEVMRHLHRLRALADVVVVGAGTAALDNPRLTTRLVEGEHPVRVLLDPDLRLPRELQALHDDQAPTLVACDAMHAAEAARRFGRAQVLAVDGLLRRGAEPDMRALIDALAARGLRVIFVEGGGVTVSRFMAQGCMDRLHLSIAPVVVGGGRPGLQLPPSERMGDCARPASRTYAMGADLLWDLDLRRPAASAAR